MAKIWINPAFAKKEIKPEKDIDIASKPSSVISGPQKKSRAFIQNLIDTKSYVNEQKRTIVTVIEDEIGNEFRGQSYCSVDDEFNKDFGEKLKEWKRKEKYSDYNI